MHSIITTPYGRPAFEALARAVGRAKAGDPLREVMVVVATEPVKVGARRWLAGHGPAGGPGIAGVALTSLYRLAESIAAPLLAGGGRRPVTTPVLVGAMRGIVGQAPTSFQQVADHPQTARALADASRALSALDPELLPALAACRQVTGEVVELHRQVRGLLREQYYDEEELLEAASQMVADVPPLVLHLPRELSPSQQRFVSAVAAITDVTAIVGITGTPADERVLQSVTAALPGSGPGVEPLPPPLGDLVLCATDPDDEVRAVVRVVEDHLQAGLPGHRIAVVHPATDPYARILHEQLTAAGIVHYGRGVRPAAELIYGRAVRGLLALPERDFRRAEVTAWLADARPEGPSAQAVERVSRAASVVAGPHWDERLAEHVRLQMARAEQEEDDVSAERRRQEAKTADEARTFVMRLEDGLRDLAGARSWTQVAQEFEVLWRWLFPQAHGTPDEVGVYDEVLRIVDGLRGLDGVAGVPSLAALQEIVELELRGSSKRLGLIGTGVMVGPIPDAVGQEFDLLCMVGMAEGTLPPASADDPLLPEPVRALTSGVLPTLRERQQRLEADVVAALSSAPRRVLSFPRGDIRSSTCPVPSRWLMPTMRHYLGDVTAIDWYLRNHPQVVVLDSYAAALLVRDPVTEVEYRQRAALADGDLVDPVRREMLGDREDCSFSRFTGLVGTAVPIPPVGPSPTALQSWLQCPHHYFTRQVLRVREPEDPDETLEMSVLDQGTLMHRVLERLVGEWQDPGYGEPWPAHLIARLEDLVEEEFALAEASGLIGLRTPWQRVRRRMRRDLLAWVARDDELRADGGWKPLAAELRFDDLPVALPGGDMIHVRGSVDRVDIDASGSLRVLDYKTGSPRKYRISEQNPTRHGMFLQLPLYALAAQQRFGRGPRPTLAQFWFIAGRSETIGYPVTDAVLQNALAVIQTAVSGIRHGLFPPRPMEHSKGFECPSCAVDGQEERMTKDEFVTLLSDPRLADYRSVL